MAGPTLASASAGPQAFDLTNLANLKGYLFAGNASPPTTSDTLLQRLISAYSQVIQEWLGYDVGNGIILGATTYTETLDSVWDGSGWSNEWVYQIPIRFPPVTAVSSVTIDGNVVPSGGDGVRTPGWFLDATQPWSIFVAGYGPIFRGKKDVVVVYTGGYAAIPFDVEQACIEMITLRFKSIDRLGVRSQAMAGETTTYDTSALPDSIQAALRPYKRMVVG
jgi:hypothetical protein